MKCLLLLTVVGVALALRDQSIAVRGKLLCGSKPAANVRVKLWEEDSGNVHPKHSMWLDVYEKHQVVKISNFQRVFLLLSYLGPDPDDLLDQGYTDANGEFQLSGGTAELTPIDPVFKVYHDCDDGIKVCTISRILSVRGLIFFNVQIIV
ncbi:unnamed protein product [Strongylus vulgaris]|uniref:Transthyretin/hydroxyisourate hydrolase domain-containing protein n=1 Tax=Strongylus vulgaris TaxID=40348 RepID=A0A3P7L046_STRVU|nr:unnamed protein product [Strongylus vulgaris]